MERAGYGVSLTKGCVREGQGWRYNSRNVYVIAKRMFDIVGGSFGLLVLSFPMLIVYMAVRLESPGGGLFRQSRVGRFGVPFTLYKFRTMSGRSGGLSLTVRDDARVTRLGRFLRRKKWDEWPQLWNILRGDMSFVGPRPEVPRYVARYTQEQRSVLCVRPGLTDPASLAFIHEEDLLDQSRQDPELTYLRDILPVKIRLSQAYIEKQSLGYDCWLVLKTLLRVLR